MSLPLLLVIGQAFAVLAALVFRRAARISPRIHSLSTTSPRAGQILFTFGLILAAVLLISLRSYDGARASVSEESKLVAKMNADAATIGSDVSGIFQRQLVCYGVLNASDEWPEMQRGRASPLVTAQVTALSVTLARAADRPRVSGSVIDALSADTRRLSTVRSDRLDRAGSTLPPVLWILLTIGALVAISMAALATAGGPLTFQLASACGTALVATAVLMLAYAVDRPFSSAPLHLSPTFVVDQQRNLPCPSKLDRARAREKASSGPLVNSRFGQ